MCIKIKESYSSTGEPGTLVNLILVLKMGKAWSQQNLRPLLILPDPFNYMFLLPTVSVPVASKRRSIVSRKNPDNRGSRSKT